MRSLLSLIVLLISLESRAAWDTPLEVECRGYGQLKPRAIRSVAPESYKYAEEFVSRDQIDLIRASLRSRLPSQITDNPILNQEVARRMREKAEQGYELVAAKIEQENIQLSWYRNPDLVPKSEMPPPPEWVAAQREQLDKRWAKPHPPLRTLQPMKSEWTSGTPLTLKTMEGFEPGSYHYVAVHGENFLRLGKKDQHHFDFSGSDPMDVAGDLIIQRGADGKNTVTVLSTQSSSYTPPLHYLQLPPRYLWDQGIYPRQLLLHPHPEVDFSIHLVAPTP